MSVRCCGSSSESGLGSSRLRWFLSVAGAPLLPARAVPEPFRNGTAAGRTRYGRHPSPYGHSIPTLSQARRDPRASRAWPGSAGWARRDVRRSGPAIPPPCPVNGSTAGVGCVVACVTCSGVCLLTQPDCGPLGQAGSSSTTSVRVAKEPGRDDRSFNVSFKRLFFCRTLPPFGELHK